jgi:hypothetical protein
MINVIISLHTGRQTIWVMYGKYWYITNLAIDVSWCKNQDVDNSYINYIYCIHNWHIIIKTRTDQKDGAHARSNSRIILHPFHDLNVLSLAPWVTCHVAILLHVHDDPSWSMASYAWYSCDNVVRWWESS